MPGGKITTSVDQLVRALEEAWSAETSAAPDWSPKVPARGQCAVSALIIQDELGGALIRALVEGGSHYWNRLHDARDLDVTRSQFDIFEPKREEFASREYVLSFPETLRRYEVLRNRVRELLADST